MTPNAPEESSWLESAELLAKQFASDHQITIATTERIVSAAFEIGSLHALLHFYAGQQYALKPTNLNSSNEYRYLTSPQGNPSNFSFVEASGKDGDFEIRQQVRIYSHADQNIAFTPDIVVLAKGASIEAKKDADYSSGKKQYFRVCSASVVAAHECKSMNPFPELLISFVGMLVCGHHWYEDETKIEHSLNAGHLAPTLFVGGAVRALHLKMITALQKKYKLNIVCGLHQGTWNLTNARNRLLWPSQTASNSPVSDEDLPF